MKNVLCADLNNMFDIVGNELRLDRKGDAVPQGQGK